MRVRNIIKNEIEIFAKLTNTPLDKFKENFFTSVSNGITKLDWCFVLEDNSEVLGGIIYSAFDKELTFGIHFFSPESSHIQVLLNGSLELMKQYTFHEVSPHLYSDKKGYEKYKKAFLSCGFEITQEKKSYLWKEGCINTPPHQITFKSLEKVGDSTFIDAIERVTENTFDKDDLDSIRDFGSHNAAVNYFNSLKDIDFNPTWWHLGYVNSELIGLIIPQKFDEVHGAINYIGVVPEQRGKGYIDDFLIEGTRILKENGIKSIIGDIDVDNYPMEASLIRQNYKFDCSMLVLKKSF